MFLHHTWPMRHAPTTGAKRAVTRWALAIKSVLFLNYGSCQETRHLGFVKADPSHGPWHGLFVSLVVSGLGEPCCIRRICWGSLFEHI